MKHKIIVGQVQGVYVISDDGAVSRKLGVKPPVPWHLVADKAENIGIRVAQMERLLDTMFAHDEAVAAAKSSLPASNGNGNGNGKGSPKITLDDLGLKRQQLWRLKQAGFKTVAQLGRHSESDLLATDGIGPAIVKAVQSGLKKHGLRLTQPVG
jgi:hypothetical protein